MLFVLLILQLSSTIRLRNRRQAVRIILKELESLSFDIASDDVIKELQDELHTIKVKYQKNVSKENGLHLYTQVQPTSSFERVRKLKIKYKRLRQQVVPYDFLIPKMKAGRPRNEYHYRNRVGKKASNWRKVTFRVDNYISSNLSFS